MSEHNISVHYIMLNALLNNKLVKRLEGALNYHGVSYTEFMILHHLHSSPTNTMRRMDLANAVGITASGVTRLLAPMEKNHLVEKEANPRDARVSLVKLSDTGQRVYQESAVAFEHCASSLTSPLTENQLEKLIELSQRLM